MGKLLYRPILGDILLANLRIAPAIVFYAMFPVGIVTFAVVPALKSAALALPLDLVCFLERSPTAHMISQITRRCETGISSLLCWI